VILQKENFCKKKSLPNKRRILEKEKKERKGARIKSKSGQTSSANTRA
jgi:hypothetical protein